MDQGQKTNARVYLGAGFACAAAFAVALFVTAASPSAAQCQEGGCPDNSVPNPCDFVTSGGFVINEALRKVSFGAHGGCKNGEFWGQINVVDHATGYHVNGTEVTAYLAPFGVNDGTRDVCGWATTNLDQQPMRFRVRLIDMGEPGSLDQFGILLGKESTTSSGTFDETYRLVPALLSAQKPGGGNVQLHRANNSTSEPPVAGDDATLCGGLMF